MDPRTEVHRAVKDESSDDESRLSPVTPSHDDDVDSDKSNSNSKKRKRGSYRCSRCGMPKRGHNCPDTFEGVHFAIVDSPTPAGAAQGVKSGANSQTVTPPFAAKASFDDCNRETLLMHLNALYEENMHLRQENVHLHEVCQFQAHALQSMHTAPQGEFARAGNGMPVVMRAGGPQAQNAMYPQGPPALPMFAPSLPKSAPSLPHNNLHTPAAAPSAASGPNAAPSPVASSSLPLPLHAAPAPSFRNGSLTNEASPADELAPGPKRAKLTETPQSTEAEPFFLASQNHYAPVSGPFPPDHLSDMNRHLHFPTQHAVSVGMDHASPYDFDYDRHEWLDNDSITSDYSPSLEASPPLIY